VPDTRNLKEIDLRTENDNTALTDIGINRSVNMTPHHHSDKKITQLSKSKVSSLEGSIDDNLVNMNITKAQTPPPN